MWVAGLGIGDAFGNHADNHTVREVGEGGDDRLDQRHGETILRRLMMRASMSGPRPLDRWLYGEVEGFDSGQ
ncbi:MAG: hypothetical protein P8N50_02410 [Actinomycetota bacterium]|jgi:hypothetical protein|nr:hypothetical protein [Actinomycetota bacterium]